MRRLETHAHAVQPRRGFIAFPHLPVLAATSLMLGCAAIVFEGAESRTIQLAAPEPPAKRVEVTQDKIVIHDKIHFEFDSDMIKPRSYDLLKEIASTINEHPEIRRIRIEGHASAEGTDAYNLDLSTRRAGAVLSHLIQHGSVSKDWLTSEGYGESQPIASNEDEAGRARNRRVEFMIVQRAGEAPPAEERRAEASETNATPSGGLP